MVLPRGPFGLHRGAATSSRAPSKGETGAFVRLTASPGTTNDAPGRPSHAFVILRDAVGRSSAQVGEISGTAMNARHDMSASIVAPTRTRRPSSSPCPRPAGKAPAAAIECASQAHADCQSEKVDVSTPNPQNGLYEVV